MLSFIITKHFLLEHNMKFNWRIVVGNYIGCPKNISDDQIRCTKNFYWFFNFKSFFFCDYKFNASNYWLKQQQKKIENNDGNVSGIFFPMQTKYFINHSISIKNYPQNKNFNEQVFNNNIP
jgi:hypothetical protein